jgi:hypothetical protein
LLAGIRAGGLLWFDPAAVPVGLLSASLDWQAPDPVLWATSVRFSANYGASPTVRPESGAAKFRLVSGTLEACPLRLSLPSSTSLRPCLGLEVGSLSARGIAGGPITDATEAFRKWWVVHEGLRIDVGIGRGWRVEAQAGAAEPLFAYEFVFRTPDIRVLRVAWVAPSASLGLSLRFL